MRAHLDEVGGAMVGNWRGIVTTPWIPPYPVALTFGNDGRYSAKSLDPSSSVAFYYGTDDDHAFKQYRLEDVSVLGRVRGEIDIVFGYGAGSYDVGAWQGLIQELVLDASGDRLRFEFARSDGYGPVTFDLWRCK